MHLTLDVLYIEHSGEDFIYYMYALSANICVTVNSVSVARHC